MKNKPERIDNIAKQKAKIPDISIKVVDAVNGNEMTDDQFLKLYQDKIISKKLYENATTSKKGKGEVGCYLSHLKIYKMKSTAKYTVIFEDDFEIREDFEHKLSSILDNISNRSVDFDYLHLTNLNENHGERIVDNVYRMDKDNTLYGTQGYVINRANIDRILRYTEFADRPIDNQIQDQGRKDNLLVLVVWPVIVWHNVPPNGSTLEGLL